MKGRPVGAAVAKDDHGISTWDEKCPHVRIAGGSPHGVEADLWFAGLEGFLDDDCNLMLSVEVVSHRPGSTNGGELVVVGKQLFDQISAQSKLRVRDTLQARQLHGQNGCTVFERDLSTVYGV